MYYIDFDFVCVRESICMQSRYQFHMGYVMFVFYFEFIAIDGKTQ